MNNNDTYIYLCEALQESMQTQDKARVIKVKSALEEFFYERGSRLPKSIDEMINDLESSPLFARSFPKRVSKFGGDTSKIDTGNPFENIFPFSKTSSTRSSLLTFVNTCRNSDQKQECGFPGKRASNSTS